MAKRKSRKKQEKKEFNKFKELGYVILWLGVPASTIAILNYYGIRDYVISGLIVIIVLLLISNYLKSKEIQHLKNGK